MRWLAALACLFALTLAPAGAQDFTGLARLDVGQSRITDAPDGASVTLYLSQPVPWRAFTLDDPRRLVLDFREIDWRGAARADLLQTEAAHDLRFGTLRPGWSRMVLDLARPLAIQTAGMEVVKQDNTAILRLHLAETTDLDFADRSGAPPDPAWDLLAGIDLTTAPPPARPDGPPVIVVDAGHGGIDPGAERGGLVEAHLMLTLAIELAEALIRTGDFHVVLTREADVFVPLAERMTIARAAGADAFLSLHADALDMVAAVGGSVYTLSAQARDQASQRMAERHNRGDLLAGLDLAGQDDTVATILMDLARLETAPRAERLADALVAAMREAGAVLNSRPRRDAPLAVLNAADFPSVLIEVGFLSSAADRARLSTDEGRAPIVDGIVRGLQAWAEDEAIRAPLLRQ
ncbi:MAG: N-acetylmuramoyl-L-alanine amidase [Rubellimicrobium sp.]|nr:N-acetylmuramoyl-L-alanine amidase [Rubellimicrobium sp.]